jgi:hypothetical protein
MDHMEIQTKDPSSYFNNEMKDEFYVALARRNAAQMIKRLNSIEICARIEKHIQQKFKDQLVGS